MSRRSVRAQGDGVVASTMSEHRSTRMHCAGATRALQGSLTPILLSWVWPGGLHMRLVVSFGSGNRGRDEYGKKDEAPDGINVLTGIP